MAIDQYGQPEVVPEGTDPWFDQWYDPSTRTGNTGINGGASGTLQSGLPPPPVGIPGVFGEVNASSPVFSSQQGGAGGPITMQQFDEAWQSSPYPGTVEGLKQFYAAHPEYAAAGITLGGSKGDKVYGPGGSYWGDAVIAAGLGGQGKSRLSGDTGGSAGGGTLGGLGSGNAPYLDPYGGQYAMPTLDELQNSPGYQARLQEGLKGVQNSAFARGTGLTGGTLKAIEQYGQNFASNEYNNLFGQKYAVQSGNFDIYKRNQDAPFSKLYNLAQLGKPGA